MYEKEEEMLHESKSRLEQIEIPEIELKDAIQQGLLHAKSKRRKRKQTVWMVTVAAIVMLTFVTSIRVSPAFASAVASIPGMERFVHLIQFDKGLEAIIENDYFEPIGVSQEKENMTLTIDGIIIDETGAEIFYTFASPQSLKYTDFKEIALLNNGKKLEASYSYDPPNQEDASTRKADHVSFVFVEPEKFTSNEFELTLQVEVANKTTNFHIPFTIKNEIKNGKVFAVNEEVIMDNQKIRVKEIVVYPLRVAVTMEFDDQNDMEILQFEDMRIEDENGEIWSSIQNGIGAFGSAGDNERTYFLQSNYFKQPKELYFKFDKVQALPKEEKYLLIDFSKKQVLKQPSLGKVKVTDIQGDSFKVEYAPIRENHSYSIFSQGVNAKGETVDIPSLMTSSGLEIEYAEAMLDAKGIINPVRIDFVAYPNYLDGSVTVQIK